MRYLLLLGTLFVLFSCEDPATPGNVVPKTVEQDLSLPSQFVNGTQLHVETFGVPTNPVVVLIHGGPGGDYRSLLKAKAFADEGYFVIFYDQRGTGLSKRVAKSQFRDNGVQLSIDDLDALISLYKKAPTQKVFLVGHSWGAMLATAYINQFPNKIAGVVLAEPGGFTWKQTEEYLSRSNKIKLFSEAMNDAVFPEQVFSGRDEHEILDYKASYFTTFENAPGNTIGNPGSYPFWRNGAVAFSSMIDYADEHGFDFTTSLKNYTIKILFTYSERNKAYGLEWAKKVGAVFQNVEYKEVTGCGHEMLHFGWESFYPQALTYLNSLK